jgi:uncharacterized membrane protein YhaH (DUF805 family)
MSAIIERYFSFHGRLARLPFFIRSIYLSIASTVLMIASIPLFANGSRILWWAGLVVVIAAIAVPALGEISLTVRRLHDLGLSGYHAIWVAAADAAGTILSYDNSDLALYVSLPLLAIGLWLLFWPGQAGANRFGETPA